MSDYRRALMYTRPYWRRLLLGILLASVLFLLSLVPPLFTQRMIDDALIIGDSDMLNILCLVLLVVFVFDTLFGLANYYVFTKLSLRVVRDIQISLFRRLQHLPLQFFEMRRGGGLSYRILADSQSIVPAITIMPADTFLYVVTLIVVSGILFSMNWQLTMWCLFILPLHAVVIVAFRRHITETDRKAREASESLYGRLSDFFTRIRLARAFSTESSERRLFEEGVDRRQRAEYRSTIIQRFSGLSAGFVSNAFYFLAFWYGGHAVIRNEMSLGALVAFFMLVRRLYTPIAGLTNTVLGYQLVRSGIRRTFEILDSEQDRISLAPGHERPQIRGEVRFENVAFAYVPGRHILSDINLHITRGTTVALVGWSGVGKTTLTNLLVRFYEPSAGRILIDGTPIEQIELEYLRSQIGLVLQEPCLFDATVRENIAYGCDGTNFDDIVNAAKTAKIHDTIMNMPRQYEANIGTQGARLSFGERQRIAIARVFLRNPKILIMDEATSSVDLETEIQIYQAVRRLMEGRTTFVIAHRLQTVLNADRIIVLRGGRIVEEGTHDELLSLGGWYRRLYGGGTCT
ncbi:ABC transporter ATP-binding protein [Candidatus Zixiibacteriota bacterium]